MGPLSRSPTGASLALAVLWLASAALGHPDCPDIFQETFPRTGLDAGRLALLANATRPERLRQLAKPLMVARPVGSAGHAAVRARLSVFLRRRGWRVGQDRFLADTPVGRRRFASVVATRPVRRSGAPAPLPVLVLAAHYDSAPLPGFVGATDSAVPCAILLMLAEAIDALSAGRRAAAAAAVRVVFFDGEESLGGAWSRADSLYGSRHLAARWLREPSDVNPDCPAAIADVSELVLLDLIGARGPRLVYAPAPAGGDQVLNRVVTGKERRDFARLAALEAELRAAGRLPEADDHPGPFFAPPDGDGDDEDREDGYPTVDTVDDDHAPFRRLGVPALHLVPRPFPAGWHTPADNASAVHWGHSAAVARVLLAWALETVGQ